MGVTGSAGQETGSQADMEERITFSNRRGERLAGVLHQPREAADHRFTREEGRDAVLARTEDWIARHLGACS